MADAGTVIAELFHLAGSKISYSDKQLARAVFNSQYAAAGNSTVGTTDNPVIPPQRNPFDPRYVPQNDETEENEHAYSRYFHTIQANLCNVSPGTIHSLP